MGDQNETFEPTKRSAQLPEQFWKAVECVGPVAKAIPLWSTVIDHFTLLSKEQEESRDVVEQLYQRAIVTEPPISTHFKTRFLTWISSRKGQFLFYLQILLLIALLIHSLSYVRLGID